MTLVAIASIRGGPPGTTWVAASRDGVVQINLGGPRQRFLRELRARGYETGGKPVWVDAAAKQIREYLQGHRRSFRLKIVPPPQRPFSARVFRALQKVPFGRTVTYGELAARAGSRHASRAVGNVMASNPLPIIVPCHRVVATSGLGGFGGGLRLKRDLLRLEGARIP